jgi:deoxyribodipyrimidine photo-lyase
MTQKLTIFWFRRDLRLDDNNGLFHALTAKNPVLPIFIFDTEILDKLPKNDARVTFILENLQQISAELQQKFQSNIAIYHGNPIAIFEKITTDFDIDSVFTNHDYEPYATKRDEEIAFFLLQKNIQFQTFKDQVFFEKNEIVKKDGNPYVVYTPFMRSWKEKFKSEKLHHFNSENHLENLVKNI